MIIRRATEEDLGGCLRLLTKLFPGKAARSDKTTLWRPIYNRLLASENSEVFVAEDGKRIVGLVDVTFRETFFHRGPTMIIEDLVVDRRYRRRGIGTDLVRKVEAAAQSRGVSVIELSSELKRSDAHRFWEALGYTRLAYQFRKKVLSPERHREAVKRAAPYFVEPQSAPKLVQFPGLETTILTGLNGERMMMVASATLPEHTVPIHRHPHEQIGIVRSGSARLRIGNQERLVHGGDVYRIPANVPHGDTCVGDEPFVMLDIFCPIREDFVRKLREQAKTGLGENPERGGRGARLASG